MACHEGHRVFRAYLSEVLKSEARRETHLAMMAEGSQRRALSALVAVPVMMDAPRSTPALNPCPVRVCTRPPTLSLASSTIASTPHRCSPSTSVEHQQRKTIAERRGTQRNAFLQKYESGYGYCPKLTEG